MGLPVGAKAGQVFQEGRNGRTVTSFIRPFDRLESSSPRG